MNLKNEKGITSIDITVSIILITLFVAIIATLIYNINSNSNSIGRNTEAMNYAINEIEKIKASNFNDLKDSEENIENTGYYKKIIVTDYADLEQNKNNDTIISGLVKKVKVEISYKNGDIIETVDLSTVRTKYD